MIVTVIVAECVRPPPVPFTVKVWEPRGAFLGMAMVAVDLPEPGAGIGFTLKVTPVVLDSVIAELNPPLPLVWMVEVPVAPRAMVSVLGVAPIWKLAFDEAVTVNVIVVVCVTPPPVPVTVIGYVPATAVAATAMVAADVPDPGAAIEVGLKVTVTPVGWPVAERATAESNPPEMVEVMVDEPLAPCATETVLGEAESAKVGDAAPASALIKPLPFGLPHPVARSKPTVAGQPLLPLVMSWKSVS